MRPVLLLLLITTFALISCGDDDPAATTATTTANALSATTSNLSTVSTAMVPESLAYTASSSIVDSDGDGNPCTLNGTQLSLPACQPILVRMYISMLQEISGGLTTFLGQVGVALGDLADGASGTATDGDNTIEYSKTDSDTFSVLIKQTVDGSPIAYLNADGDSITVQMDMEKMADATADDVGKIEWHVNYTDENNWEMDITMADLSCDDTDVAAPEDIKIVVNNIAGILKGQAMMHHPRFTATDATGVCDATTPSTSTRFFLYTEFVANDTAAKANVYGMDASIADVTSTVKSNYALKNLCVEYNQFGTNNVQCLGHTDVTGYAMNGVELPFCSTSTAQTWNSDCTGTDATIQAADFLTTSFTAPSTFLSTTVTMPTSL